MKCFHGTDLDSKNSILSEGFKILEKINNGKHFGNGVYLTDKRESAFYYGEHIVEVDVDENALMNITSMKHFNEIEISAMFHGGIETYLSNNGFKGFKLTDIEGNVTILVYDLTILKSEVS